MPTGLEVGLSKPEYQEKRTFLFARFLLSISSSETPQSNRPGFAFA